MAMLACAVLSLAAAYAACLASIVSVTRRRPLGLCACLAVAVLVCAEAVLLHGLSLVRGVGRLGLLAGQAAVVVAGLAISWRRLPALAGRLRRSRPVDPSLAWVAGLGVLALGSALVYRPNNWDSMTYHLARVAYWIQNGSVGPYPTNVARQVALPPGAEYLLTVLQGISGSDRAAALVQYGSWWVLALSARPLARTFGVPRAVARWATVFVAAVPMALLQASSTQNDLVAAVLAVATVAASAPFLHPRHGWRTSDLIVVVACLTAGAVVKPTSVVASAPILARAAAGTLRHRAFLAPARRMLPVLLIPLTVLGPALMGRASVPGNALPDRPFVYVGLADMPDRALNGVRGLLRNLPLPLPSLDRLSPGRTVGCSRPRSLCLEYNLAPTEDVCASPASALVLLLGLGLAMLRWRALTPRARLGIAASLAAWGLFHAVFRDNVWLPRLQLPLFAVVTPLALAGFPSPGRPRSRATAVALGTLAAGAIAHAALGAVMNARRPWAMGGSRDEIAASVRAASSEQAYYVAAPRGLRLAHETVLDRLAASGCRRLGMFIGEDSYDYPLSWRAMRSGVEVRHVVGPDAWPCAVYSDRGPPPPPPRGAWRQTDTPTLFLAAD